MNQPPEDLLQKLPGLPLTKTTRNGNIQYFHFGKAQVHNSSGLILDVGEFTLAVSGTWTLFHKGNTITSFYELFLPKHPDSDSLNWQVPGNNLRDVKLMELINQSDQKSLTVEEVRLHAGFGLEIFFKNNLILQLISQKSANPQPDLLWTFFSNLNKEQVIEGRTNGISENSN